MNHLKYDPSLINNTIIYLDRSHTYTFLDTLSEGTSITPIYDYLCSIEMYKLKNIWNHFVKKWKKMDKEMKDNKKYQKSPYSDSDLSYIHINMNDEKLNDLFSLFIETDQCKCIFVINTILTLI
jgi:hypothetical protein